MGQRHPKHTLILSRQRSGTTLLELLIIITIISLLMAILVPALSGSQEAANVARCLSNLRQIVAIAGKYSNETAAREHGNRPTLPWHLGANYGGMSVSWISEYVYGGFKAPIQHPDFPNMDAARYPAEWRPFNKYVAPGPQRAPIDLYICPSDSSSSIVMVGETTPEPEMDVGYSSWQVNGNSYPINWYWYEDARYNGCRNYSDIDVMSSHGSDLLNSKIGGSASKFVLFMENAMNVYMLSARPPDGSQGESELQRLGYGWHRKFSMYSMAMWDGHAEYRYIDTRYTADSSYNTWPDPTTPGCGY